MGNGRKKMRREDKVKTKDEVEEKGVDEKGREANCFETKAAGREENG